MTAVKIAITIAAFLSLMIMFITYYYYKSDIGQRVDEQIALIHKEGKPIDMLEKNWYDQSYAGTNIYNVIALRVSINQIRALPRYEAHMGMTSALYSQIKYAWRVHRDPCLSVALLYLSIDEARITERLWTPLAPIIDLEVLTAPQFMFGVTPLLGKTLFKEYRATALGALIKAHEALMVRDSDVPHGADAALILVKLYRLSGEPLYKEELRRVGATHEWDQGVLERVRKHLAACGDVYEDTDELLRLFFQV
jgi:hypothetical protein